MRTGIILGLALMTIGAVHFELSEAGACLVIFLMFAINLKS